MYWSINSAAVVLGSLSALAEGQQPANVGASESFDWDSLPASTALSYRACYDGFECARLVVPMDWQNKTDPRIAVLAVIRLPAVVPASDPSFGGSVLTNPGGPGGSGVDQLRGGGRKLRDTLDKPGKKHYEIMSFDPRGVGNSWPRANCLPNNDLARDAFAYEERGIGILDGSDPAAVPRILGMYRSFLQKCRAEDAAGTPGAEIMGFMSTPSVARDMVQIIDKIDEHLKSETIGDSEKQDQNDDARRLELKKRASTDDVPRLQYVGYSYGTILGNYFASLFPERVGRLILDGVVDAKDYSSGPVSHCFLYLVLCFFDNHILIATLIASQGWVSSTVDADNITSHFYSGCHAAGPSNCRLAQAGDKSGADILARVEDFISALADAPIPVMTPGGGFTALSLADVRIAAAITNYSPRSSFKPLAAALADLLAGNSTTFVTLLDKLGAFPHLRDACGTKDSLTVPVMQLTVNEASIATRCSDGEDVSGRSVSWWRDFIAGQAETSRTFGSFWSKIRLPCAGFTFPRNWSFQGPFTTPHFERTPNGEPVKGKPAAPLLFLSSRLDPVTPLASARRMAAGHPGAVVVVQESMGHCALGTAKSDCTTGIAREYMDTGKVPSRETVCQADFDPWTEEDGKTSSFVVDVSRFPF